MSADRLSEAGSSRSFSRSQALSTSTSVLRSSVLSGASTTATERFFALRKERAQRMLDARRAAFRSSRSEQLEQLSSRTNELLVGYTEEHGLAVQEWDRLFDAMKGKFGREWSQLKPPSDDDDDEAVDVEPVRSPVEPEPVLAPVVLRRKPAEEVPPSVVQAAAEDDLDQSGGKSCVKCIVM